MIEGSFYYNHYQRLRPALFALATHGIRVDLEGIRTKTIELERRTNEIKRQLDTLTGGYKLYAEKSTRSATYKRLLERLNVARENYKSLPKADRSARRAFKADRIDPLTAKSKDLRASGLHQTIEVGVGLSNDKCIKYLSGTLGLALKKKKRKGSGKVTVTIDDVALKKLKMAHPLHGQLIDLILEHRKCNKLMGYLGEAKIDPDGRWRASWKLTGTQTGRLASAANPLGSGLNLQNVDRQLKPLMIPDEDPSESEERHLG